jgi:inosine/xanthosine triphosphatase
LQRFGCPSDPDKPLAVFQNFLRRLKFFLNFFQIPARIRNIGLLMPLCRIAAGSTRRPKLNAVAEAASLFRPFFPAETTIEVKGYEVASGVSHTPTSREELLQGARQRAEALALRLTGGGDPASFYVGLEGRLDVLKENGNRRVFLESWAYVTDTQRGHFGCSGSIEIPESLAEEVLVKGTELSVAIDEFAGQTGIRNAQGAWGVLSGDLISRQESFRLAVLSAFAPFYNQNYRTARSART